MKTAVVFLFSFRQSADDFLSEANDPAIHRIVLDGAFQRAYAHDPVEHKLKQHPGCYGVLVKFSGYKVRGGSTEAFEEDKAAVAAAYAKEANFQFHRSRNSGYLLNPGSFARSQSGRTVDFDGAVVHDCNTQHNPPPPAAAVAPVPTIIGTGMLGHQPKREWIVLYQHGMSQMYWDGGIMREDAGMMKMFTRAEAMTEYKKVCAHYRKMYGPVIAARVRIAKKVG